jgi:hypothetical protein
VARAEARQHRRRSRPSRSARPRRWRRMPSSVCKA